MGVAVFSGMLGVTLFGLFLTPVFYVVLRTLEKWITGRALPVNHSHVSFAPNGASHASLDLDRPRNGDAEEAPLRAR